MVPQGDVLCELTAVTTASSDQVLTVTPARVVFSPPRALVGRDVLASVGLRVVLSEEFQVIPRLGDGTIIRILNDNLDLVAVDWDQGPQNQTLATGAGGMLMLARAEPLPQVTVTVSHVGIGNATLRLLASSYDPVPPSCV